jgi:FkbM family methyltransferase
MNKSLNLLLLFNFIGNNLRASEDIVILPYNDSQAALNFIKTFLPDNPVVLEAGAFDGKDSIRISTFWPKSIVHSFEPVDKIFKLLIQNTQQSQNIICYNYALSNKNGKSNFYLSELPGQPDSIFASGSILQPKEHLNVSPIVFAGTTEVETTTLDLWAQANKIKNIDFLWLDMQGHELTALMNGVNILQTVKVIYVEVEYIEAYAGQYQYKDVKKWLEDNGFELKARDTPKPYFDQQPFWYGNAIFVRK